MVKKKDQNQIEVEEQNVTPDGPRDSVKETGLLDAVWNFLSSMKLGIILLLVMAIASIIGTIWVPKDQFGREDFVAFYNSPLFRLLMGLLALNLLVCSLNRWKVIVNTLKGPKSDVSVNFIRNLKSAQSIKVASAPSAVGESVKGLLKKKGYRIFESAEGDTVKISSDRGHLGILGPYITHLSFIIMIVAIVIKFSGLSGWEGTLAGMEGQTYNLNQLMNVEGKLDPQDNFEIRIDDFRTEYRPDGSVKQWNTDVTVIDKVKNYPFNIFVNQPLVHKGIKFYQSSYGYQFTGKFAGTEGAEQQFTVGMNEYVQPPGTNITYIPFQYNELKKSVRVAIYSGQQFVKEVDIDENKPFEYEKAKVTFGPTEAYTVLTVKKDPGVPIMGLASLLLTAGIIMSFILRQRRIWAVVTPDKDGSVVQIGGQSAKDKHGVDTDVDEIVSELKV